jgi:hypothetical protein
MFHVHKEVLQSIALPAFCVLSALVIIALLIWDRRKRKRAELKPGDSVIFTGDGLLHTVTGVHWNDAGPFYQIDNNEMPGGIGSELLIRQV